MRARVIVQLKREVSDPEGIAIGEALSTLHFDAVRNVRVGKVFDVELADTDRERAQVELDRIARDVLSNPVIEEYSFEFIDEPKA